MYLTIQSGEDEGIHISQPKAGRTEAYLTTYSGEDGGIIEINRIIARPDCERFRVPCVISGDAHFHVLTGGHDTAHGQRGLAVWNLLMYRERIRVGRNGYSWEQDGGSPINQPKFRDARYSTPQKPSPACPLSRELVRSHWTSLMLFLASMYAYSFARPFTSQPPMCALASAAIPHFAIRGSWPISQGPGASESGSANSHEPYC